MSAQRRLAHWRGPSASLFLLQVLATDIDAKSRSMEFNASVTMVVIVSVAVVHVEAVTSLDTTSSAEAFIADLATDAFCACGDCQKKGRFFMLAAPSCYT